MLPIALFCASAALGAVYRSRLSPAARSDGAAASEGGLQEQAAENRVGGDRRPRWGALHRPKLDSVLALDYPRELMEILVISDGSTDRTDSIVQEFAPQGVRLLQVPRGGKCAALNAAIPQARNEILLHRYAPDGGSGESSGDDGLLRRFRGGRRQRRTDNP
jgi:hypothetical protein